jgi:hypothetical protein
MSLFLAFTVLIVYQAVTTGEDFWIATMGWAMGLASALYVLALLRAWGQV